MPTKKQLEEQNKKLFSVAQEMEKKLSTDNQKLFQDNKKLIEDNVELKKKIKKLEEEIKKLNTPPTCIECDIRPASRNIWCEEDNSRRFWDLCDCCFEEE